MYQNISVNSTYQQVDKINEEKTHLSMKDWNLDIQDETWST